AAALFGGFCVTGLIARTATNIRAGARGPVAGMLHSVFLLVFMLAAAPLARYIPLAALAAVLAATFALVVFRDLTTGILVGFGIGTLLFLHRMAQAVEIESARPIAEADV